MGTCAKCGGGFTAPIPTVVGDFVDNDLRLATVKFRRSTTYLINGSPRNFYVAQRVQLNFSLIRALLAETPDCLVFEKNSERELFNAVG